MSALDSNVLVRYLVGDIPEQAEAARVMTPEEPGFTCHEVVWVLE